MHTATYTKPAYTNSHCNKVILWPARVNKVQVRGRGGGRRKWLSIYWLIISREGRTGERKRRRRTDQRAETEGRKDGASQKKMERNLCVNITVVVGVRRVGSGGLE